MPEMDGVTAVKQIRAGEAGRACRDAWIIAITADHRDEVREMALVAGVDDFLPKPVNLTDLEASLRRLVASRGPALARAKQSRSPSDTDVEQVQSS
jgi:CheY-like chemotaxis protein